MQKEVELSDIEAPEQESHVSHPYVTYALLAVNVLIFIFMALQGAGFIKANGLVHMLWGSNFAPLTLSGDGWRLLTNIFIHFGVIHLVMNMYALLTVGVYLEPMMGKLKYLAVYLCTGVIASLASLWWHSPPVNSAGASGAVFGLYGVFFALLTTKLIPEEARNSLLQSTIIFIGYNLFYGFKSQVDNAAHLGGLLSGFAFGFAYWIPIAKGLWNESRKWILPGFMAITIGSSCLYLYTHRESPEMRKSVLAELHDAKFPDHSQFMQKFDEFVEYDRQAVSDGGTITTAEEFKQFMQSVSLPAWDKAEGVLSEMRKMQVSEAAQEKMKLMDQYLKLRRKQVKLINRYNFSENEAFVPKLEQNQLEIHALSEKIMAR